MEQNYLLPVIGFHGPVVASGKGSYVYDRDGKKYLDLNSGQFCTVLGHGNEALARRIYETARTVSHTNTAMLSEEVLEAAQNIHRISGDLKGYSIFLSTGAEAVEFCIRYAKFIKKREGIICFDKGYHGLTLGAQSITFGGVYARPQVSEIFSVPVPDTFAAPQEIQEAADAFEQVLRQQAGKIAAAVLEPMVSVGGMIFPAAAYFQRIQALCEQYDILLIFDECQSGFGRTGKWFGYQTLGCLPDMIACAKAVGLGYPVSMAVMAEKWIPEEGFAMTHYSSHQNDGFAAAIVNFGIETIEREGILSQVEEKGRYFLAGLQKLAADERICIEKPRGCGLMLGADLKIPGMENYREYYAELARRAAQKGLIIQGTAGGRILRFLPDYLIAHEDIDFCMAVLSELLRLD